MILGFPGKNVGEMDFLFTVARSESRVALRLILYLFSSVSTRGGVVGDRDVSERLEGYWKEEPVV